MRQNNLPRMILKENCALASTKVCSKGRRSCYLQVGGPRWGLGGRWGCEPSAQLGLPLDVQLQQRCCSHSKAILLDKLIVKHNLYDISFLRKLTVSPHQSKGLACLQACRQACQVSVQEQGWRGQEAGEWISSRSRQLENSTGDGEKARVDIGAEEQSGGFKGYSGTTGIS